MVPKIKPNFLISHLCAGIILLTTFSTFVLPVQVHAKDNSGPLPSLTEFVRTVKDGNPNSLRGVYVQNVMAFPIMQQPADDDIFVSPDPDVVTQFHLAAKAGHIGLLAHNYLAGRAFINIKPDDRIILVYGDGRLKSFEMVETLRYETLDPQNPYSHFKDLESQTVLDSGELFTRVYHGDDHLTLQTCLAFNGNLSWGMFFIIARPVTDQSPDASTNPPHMMHL